MKKTLENKTKEAWNDLFKILEDYFEKHPEDLKKVIEDKKSLEETWKEINEVIEKE